MLLNIEKYEKQLRLRTFLRMVGEHWPWIFCPEKLNPDS